MQRSLFDPPPLERLGPESIVLRGLACDLPDLEAAVEAVITAAPLRHMTVPGGGSMSVGTTSCGALGWCSDARGYRYEPRDPLTGAPWPAMPEPLRRLATLAAARAGFAGYEPDSCLINRYRPRTKMGVHRDADERDFAWPIVSVSLGLPATFVFGGLRRADPVVRVPLEHGDVVVWGGVDRLRYHGVLPVKAGAGAYRTNLTFRRAG
ncbi:MAG: DNA oxidative demethylase AlkB [Sandaracinus sp.]|nr:DNA oxidative demethylase AlkB [Sandaracinus sp.]MCB9631193.1 DNA oxidative demethylase AlkB [Sandaracinus sp.]